MSLPEMSGLVREDAGEMYQGVKRFRRRNASRALNIWKEFPKLPDILYGAALQMQETPPPAGTEEGYSPHTDFARRAPKSTAPLLQNQGKRRITPHIKRRNQ
jgi:hypothetical protein